MKLWLGGDLNNLVLEGRTIQYIIPKVYARKDSNDYIANQFSKLITLGKTKAALDLLANHEKGSVLKLDDTISMDNGENRIVRDILKSKHPPSHAAYPDSIIDRDPEPTHPIIFDNLDATTIRSAAHKSPKLKLSGSNLD